MLWCHGGRVTDCLNCLNPILYKSAVGDFERDNNIGRWVGSLYSTRGGSSNSHLDFGRLYRCHARIPQHAATGPVWVTLQDGGISWHHAAHVTCSILSSIELVYISHLWVRIHFCGLRTVRMDNRYIGYISIISISTPFKFNVRAIWSAAGSLHGQMQANAAGVGGAWGYSLEPPDSKSHPPTRVRLGVWRFETSMGVRACAAWHEVLWRWRYVRIHDITVLNSDTSHTTVTKVMFISS